MQDLLLCINILAPIFIFVGLGFCLRLLHITNDNFISVGSDVLFFVLLPCSLFMNIYNSDFSAIWNPMLALFVVGIHVIAVLLLALIVPRFFKNREQCGVIIQGCFRGNVILLGLPLAFSIYGASGMGTTSVVMAYSIPLYSILGVAMLTIFGTEAEGKKTDIVGILIKIVKNPLIIGTVAALPFALLHIRLPQLAIDVVSGLGGIASTFGLIILGAQMKLGSVKQNKGAISFAVIVKLVVFPLVTLALAVLCGFNSKELGALFILTAAPMSVTSFIMASSMSKEGELAGQMVVVSTVFSMLTMLAGLYALRLLGAI